MRHSMREGETDLTTAAPNRPSGVAIVTRQDFPRQFDDAKAAVAAIAELYERNTTMLREAFIAFTKGETFTSRVRAYYPVVRIAADSLPDIDPRAAYGFLPTPVSTRPPSPGPIFSVAISRSSSRF